MSDRSQTKSTHTDFWRDKIVESEAIHLIRSTESYVVWLDRSGDIDWMTTDEYDQQGAKEQQKHNAILSEAAVLECAPCHGLSAEAKKHFKRLVGEALSYNFEDDYQTAQQVLGEAHAYIQARCEEVSRRWYVSASAIMACSMVAVGLLIWIRRDLIAAALTADFILLCLAVVAGSCGALLSVIWRSGQIKFDYSAGRALHYVEGAMRIWAGALSGVLIALAVKSEFVLAPLTRGGNATTVIMLAAFVAGAGERFATSIISSVESSHAPTAKSQSSRQKDRE